MLYVSQTAVSLLPSVVEKPVSGIHWLCLQLSGSAPPPLCLRTALARFRQAQLEEGKVKVGQCHFLGVCSASSSHLSSVFSLCVPLTICLQERRPFLASECSELPKAEKWRRQVLPLMPELCGWLLLGVMYLGKCTELMFDSNSVCLFQIISEVSKKVAQIQNG